MAALAASFVAALIASQAPWAPVNQEKSDEALGFAAALLEQRDSYRAITELKRFAWLTQGMQALHADLLIGQIYAESGAVEASRFHFERVFEDKNSDAATAARLLNLQNVCITRILTGNCAEEISLLPDNTPMNLKAYYQKYWAVLMGEPTLEKTSVGEDGAALDRQLDQLALERRNLKLKNPALAGILSAVVPGAGQAYNGRYLDAGLALVLTGLTTWGSLALLVRDNPEWAVGIPLGLVALTFYTGNIANAVGDAFRLNENTHRDFAKRMQKLAWPNVAVSLGPQGASFILVMQIGRGPVRQVMESPAPVPSEQKQP